MTYVLSGLIGDRQSLEQLAGLVVVPLAGGMGLAPLTSEFWRPRGFDSRPLLGAWDACEGDVEGFEAALPAFLAVAALWIDASMLTSIAYVEAEIWAGEGLQAAAVWEGGELVRPPTVATDAINDALWEIGVEAQEGDEFDALGLGRHRCPEDWLKSLGSTR